MDAPVHVLEDEVQLPASPERLLQGNHIRVVEHAQDLDLPQRRLAHDLVICVGPNGQLGHRRQVADRSAPRTLALLEFLDRNNILRLLRGKSVRRPTVALNNPEREAEEHAAARTLFLHLSTTP